MQANMILASTVANSPRLTTRWSWMRSSIILNAGVNILVGPLILSAGNPAATYGSLSGAVITQSGGSSIAAASLSVLNQTARHHRPE